MNYCNLCGKQVQLLIPQGDTKLRHVCVNCGEIHYQNPKIITGCIPEWENQILLCKRGIEPRHGYWTLPAGFMENGETTQQGAARETLEEANARVEISQLYTLFNLPHINQIYLLFRARLLDLDFSAGEESLQVGLFTEQQIPWDDLAFPVVAETLKLYFMDKKTGVFKHRVGDMHRLSQTERKFRVNMLINNET